MTRSKWFLAALLATTFPAVAVADDPPARDGAEPSHLNFLNPGRDYVIRFPDDLALFKKTTSQVVPTSYTAEDGTKRSGEPATWTMTLTVEIFTVVRFGGGSWFLLEHPSSADDFVKWNNQRRAIAQLADDQRVDEIEAQPDGKQQLQTLRERAARDIPTTRTWVNLDHAVAITEVPTEPLKVKFNIQSVGIDDRD